MVAAWLLAGTLLVYPPQILKGKLPYRDYKTFYGPPNPFFLAMVYYIRGIGLNPEGDWIRLPAHLSRRHVLSCPALELYRRPGARFLPRSFW